MSESLQRSRHSRALACEEEKYLRPAQLPLSRSELGEEGDKAHLFKRSRIAHSRLEMTSSWYTKGCGVPPSMALRTLPPPIRATRTRVAFDTEYVLAKFCGYNVADCC